MAWKVLDSIDVTEWSMRMFLNDSAKIGASGADNKNYIIPVSNYQSCTEGLSVLDYFCSRNYDFFSQNTNEVLSKDGQMIGKKLHLQRLDSTNTCFY